MKNSLLPSTIFHCTGMYQPCGRIAKRRRQNTQYVDEESNWVIMCDECFAENEEYWAGMWADYYRNCL